MKPTGNLSLLRRPLESIIIGDPSTPFFAIVTVTRKTTVNVKAPQGVRVIRGELADQEPPCPPTPYATT